MTVKADNSLSCAGEGPEGHLSERGLIGTWIGNFNSTSWKAGQTTESDVNLISTTQYD